MSLRNRVRNLERAVPDRPKPVPMPEACAEAVALAIFHGQVRDTDFPTTDPRRVEAVTALVACIRVAEWRRDHPDDVMNRAASSYPRLLAAAEQWVAAHPANTDTDTNLEA